MIKYGTKEKIQERKKGEQWKGSLYIIHTLLLLLKFNCIVHFTILGWGDQIVSASFVVVFVNYGHKCLT